MPKRPATDAILQEGAVYKAQSSSSRRDLPIEDEMGEFEDAWEDELESDEDVAETNDENGVFTVFYAEWCLKLYSYGYR